MLEIFSEYTCPWCYFCYEIGLRLVSEHPIEVRKVVFPLRKHTPPEGITLEEAFGVSSEEAENMRQRLIDTGERYGVAVSRREKIFNPRKAHELGKWACEQGKGDLFDRLAFEAYFVKGLNLWEEDVLLELASGAGLDREIARRVLNSEKYLDQVLADWAYSEEQDIVAAPTYQFGGRRLVGVQTYPRLEALLKLQAGIVRLA